MLSTSRHAIWGELLKARHAREQADEKKSRGGRHKRAKQARRSRAGKDKDSDVVRMDDSEVERQVDATMEAEETVLEEATESIVFGGAVQGSLLGASDVYIQNSARRSTPTRQVRAADGEEGK